MNTPEAPIYEFDDLRIDPARRLLLRRGEPVPLTPRVFDTLLYFVRHHGRVLDKEELMRAIWPDVIVEENNLNQNVSALRRALGESSRENRFIVTVPGRGYRFASDVKISAGSASDRDAGQTIVDSDEAMMATPMASGRVPSDAIRPLGRWNAYSRAALIAVVILAVVSIWFAVWRGRKQNQAPPVRIIAILPFKPLILANRDESLEIGMADTLIARLSRIHDLTVNPLSAVRKYGGQDQNPFTAGRELGVEAVLDGSIQRWGDRIRVTARLVRVSDQRQLWAGHFDEQARDIFAVQDSISEKVTRELALELTGEEKKRIAKRDTDDSKAYELYLKGRLLLAQSRFDSINKAVGFLEEAIRRDPNYALAYAGLADCYERLPVSSDVRSRDAFPQAKQAALKALQIDGESFEAHASLGWIALWYDWDWKGSEHEFRRALDVNPNYTFARAGYAHLLSDLSRNKEALNQIDQALKRDPISVLAGTLKGHFLYQARQYPEAIDQLLSTLELEPSFWVAQITLGKTYERAGRYKEALETFRKAGDLSGASSEPLSLSGYVYAVSGRRADAESTLRQLEALSKRRYVPPWYIALVYQGLGNSAEALRWLERAYDERDVHMVFLCADPKWDSMRRDPGFISLVKRIRGRT